MKMNVKNRRRILGNQSGMTLMEILIVISLIAVIGGLVGGNLFDSLDEGKVSSTKIQMKNFDGLLGQFRRHCGRYPSTEEGLRALVQKPEGGRECKRYAPEGYIQGGEIPLDPWDGEYIYEANGNRDYTISSAGPDGIVGNEDDISSKDK